MPYVIYITYLAELKELVELGKATSPISLANHFEVSESTIKRMIAVHRELGTNIQYSKADKRYRIYPL